jgi:spore germination protein
MKIKIAVLFIFIILTLAGIAGFIYYRMNSIDYQPEGPVIDYKAKAEERTSQNAKLQTLPASRFSAWIAWWNEDQAISSLEQVSGNKLEAILPAWYSLNEKGRIEPVDKVTKRRELTEFAISHGKDILPMISNDFDPVRVSSLLDDSNLTYEQIDQLVFTAKTEGYKGWDIDWEEFYEGDKIGFNDFIKILSEKSHEKNLILSVTLQAKTGKDGQREAIRGQDYETIGKYADQVRIMAYDFHGEDSEPGPVTPLDKYEQVLTYAVSTIPPEKLVIGLPTYGYDWGKDKGEGIQYKDAVNRINSFKGSFKRDPVSLALVGTYLKNNQKHTLWFEDKESIEAKIQIARSFGVYQFSFWRLGGEDETMWSIN